MNSTWRAGALIITAAAALGPAAGEGAAAAWAAGNSPGPITAGICVKSTVAVGRGPFGAAVNPRTNTIYVTNSHAGTVSVINGATNTVVATIPVGNNPLGAGVDPATNTIYVSNGFSSRVSVISGQTNTVVATIH